MGFNSRFSKDLLYMLQADSSATLTAKHTLGYPMPLPIVRLVLIRKAMNFAYKAKEFA